MHKTTMLAAGALALAIAMPGGVANAQQVVATADLNLREGPGTRFDVIRTIPSDRGLDAVYGCLPDRDWCEVQYRGTRGWVFADYLDVVREGRRVGGLADVGPRMGLPMTEPREWRREQRFEGIQPGADPRFPVPGAGMATGTLQQGMDRRGMWGEQRGRWDDQPMTTWGETRREQRFDGVQPGADPRY